MKDRLIYEKEGTFREFRKLLEDNGFNTHNASIWIRKAHKYYLIQVKCYNDVADMYECDLEKKIVKKANGIYLFNFPGIREIHRVANGKMHDDFVPAFYGYTTLYFWHGREVNKLAHYKKQYEKYKNTTIAPQIMAKILGSKAV